MKILLIHNEYIHRGGEDTVLLEEEEMLKYYGHSVEKIIFSNKAIDTSGVRNKISLFLETVWNVKSGDLIEEKIKSYNPDIIHVHNTFPLISPSIYWRIKKMNKPVVQTIHNFRLGCANALLLKDEKPCELCLEKSSINALINKCYKDNFLMTLNVVLMQKIHDFLGTFRKKVDGYIVLTEFSKQFLLNFRIPDNLIHVKPNFSKQYDIRRSISKDESIKKFTFVGRISPEKGVDFLLDTFSTINDQTIVLEIIGDGPSKNILMEKYKFQNNIVWKGKLEKNELLESLSDSISLIVPSRFYETFGMTVIEAFSLGIPVIATNHGSLPFVVDNFNDGLLFKFDDKNDLKEKILLLSNRPDLRNSLGKKALENFKYKFSMEENYKILIDIYKKVIKQNERSKQ